MTLPTSTDELGVLLADFADRMPGVTHAVAVSPGGLLMASTRDLGRDSGDQLAAIASGLLSLTQGASRCFDAGPVLQTVIELRSGYLVLMSIADGSSFAVLTTGTCDIGEVGYALARLLDQFG